MTRSEPLFKKENSLEKRSTESTRILLKYKNRVPIIIDVADSFKDQLKLDKKKYLVPSDLNVSQFLYVIRKRLELQPEHALFIFFNNTLPPTSQILGDLYKTEKDKDGFLYATVSLESVFG
jgi:GABA(A) receptor-associated protein